MAAPLLAQQFNLDARAFALFDRAAKGLHQRLDIGKDDGGRRGPREYGRKCSTMLGVHAEMLSQTDS